MLKDRIIRAVESEGPWPFERFMESALYDPDGGFFSSSVLRSDRGGDFLTSPEITPHFGRTIGAFVQAEIDELGSLALIEVGAGSGSLLRPLLDSLDALPDRVIAIEVSPAARNRLADSVPEAEVFDSLADLGDLECAVIIANELIDNLPAAVAIRGEDSWSERWVGVSSGGLVPVEVPARPEVAAWADAHGGNVRVGGVVEVQMAATGWMEAVMKGIVRGSVLVIDYGDTADGLEPRRGEGTLRTYKAHHLGPDPLAEPGATDITMDVNFTALAAAAETGGWSSTLDRQDEWLASWGLRDKLGALRHEALELAREGRVMDQIAVKSDITGVETVMHPRGLGDFRVLTAKSPTGATSGRR